jgi:nitroimidazol reductase NimA-like FMN-containing flavoprotein (pyridoxamine 5'-phosphate oxidase superfamily)
MQLADPRTGMEALDRKDAVRLLGTVPIGRVAVVVGGGAPHIVPVNFAVDTSGATEAIVFRTDAGTKLRAVGRGRVVFEADDYDPKTRSGWSVVVHGDAEEIDPPPANDDVVDPDPWAGGEKAHWVRIHATSVTGRRIG